MSHVQGGVSDHEHKSVTEPAKLEPILIIRLSQIKFPPNISKTVISTNKQNIFLQAHSQAPEMRGPSRPRHWQALARGSVLLPGGCTAQRAPLPHAALGLLQKHLAAL